MKLPCARISLLRLLKPEEALVIAGTSNAATCAATRAGVSIMQARRLLVDPVSGESLECRLVALSDETPPGAAPEPVLGYQSEGAAP